jgi:hypothetical protein
MGVYGEFDDMGIAEKKSEKVWRDEKNNIVENRDRITLSTNRVLTQAPREAHHG